ncbi:MAG: PAS domain S-box protein [Mucilaginibacter sp.]
MNISLSNLTHVFNLEFFFELSPDLLCIAGFDGYFKRINPTVSKTLGYTNEELFGRPINDFVHPDDKHITERNRDGLRQNAPLLNFENRYVTKTGEVVWLSWTSMPIESEQVIFAIAKNITHKCKMDDDRNLQLANLTKVNNDLKQLTYTTSHDLRSPVNNLLSVFSILDHYEIQDKQVLELIGVLKLATENLKDTLNNYLDVLSNKDIMNVSVEELDLKDNLSIVLHSLKALLRDSNASIDVDFSAMPTVKFNKAYLQSVLLNLITNSIKYARPQVLPVITMRTSVEDGVKQLIYTDNGMGFDMEKVKNRIFGFNQKFTDRSDSKGIGLYLVYNHITNLGGQIAIESKLNEGSKFIITFE